MRQFFSYIVELTMYHGNQVRQAIETYLEVKSFRKASFLIGISKSTIHRWWIALGQRFNKAPKPRSKQVKPRKYKTLDTDVQKNHNIICQIDHFTNQARFTTSKGCPCCKGLTMENPSACETGS